MTRIRTRFAPSPTGHLHIGSVRTALFNYLYARSQGGEFLLRIEDTDLERSKPEYEQSILDDLAWLGLRSDGTVVRQSKRLDLYRRYAEQLMREGKAVRIDEKTPAVSFFVPKKKIVVHDLIHGAVEFDAALFDDVVIMKSDGMPTYNFACVVDDHEQGITHVIRGDDHMSNTPRQWLIYEALGFEPPKSAHIPLIVGADRTPLSKRHGDVSIKHYRKEGYLASGLLNYIALLGWSPGGNQEVASLADMEKKFRLKAVGRTSAAFDDKKLAWINGEHLKMLSDKEYLAALKVFADNEKCFSPDSAWDYVEKIALLYRSRVHTFCEFIALAGHCFQDRVAYSPEVAGKLFTPEARKRMGEFAQKLGALSDFGDGAVLEKTLRDLAGEEGIPAAELIHPVRAALTGHTVSPGLFELMKVLGKERVVRRLETAARGIETEKEA